MSTLGEKKFLHDNTPVHMCAVAVAKLHELRFELIPDPPPDPPLTDLELKKMAWCIEKNIECCSRRICKQLLLSPHEG